MRFTQQELFEQGLKRGIYIAPTLDIAALLQEEQFQARGFWKSIGVPCAAGTEQTISVPGEFAKFSRTPMPLAGSAKYVSAEAISQRPGPDSAEADGIAGLPLAGLKVLDFMWVIAGPFFTRVLADYGATVIRVESSSRVDPARAAPAFKDGEPAIESGLPFADFNSGKMGITVDPSNPAGRQVILDLVAWADVVTESFSPKAMKAWGLDYQSLLAVNPNLIMLSSCLMGQTGPKSLLPGYGNMAAAISGFYDLTGWSDRSPAGPYLAYTDGVSPRFMLASVMTALEHRRSTGEGQHIDISQAEAAIHLLAPAVYDHELNGHVWHRMGNRDLQLCPHGVFPAGGEDRWVAIACQSDQAWRSLCEIAGLTSLAEDPSLSTVAGRRDREAELEELISNWSRTLPDSEIEAALIAAGVAAHVVQNSEECIADPQLKHRDHFVTVQHATDGEFVVEGTRFKMSRTPARLEAAHPELGQHNAEVLMDILGYDADQVANVFASLAME